MKMIQTLQNNQAYVGLFLALLVIIFIWWMISLKVKREVIKYGESQIRNPGDRQGETIVNPTTPAAPIGELNEQRSGVQDSVAENPEQSNEIVRQPVRDIEGEQQAVEPDRETDSFSDGTSAVPEPAEFEEI